MENLVIDSFLEKRMRGHLANDSHLTVCESLLLFQEIDAQRWRYDVLRRAEKKLSEAYLRIQDKLNAWATPTAPTPEQVYVHTEQKLDELLNALQAQR